MESKKYMAVFETRPHKPWFIILFMSFWLCLWAFGGMAAIAAFLKAGSIFLAMWLCGWVLGMFFVSSFLFWMFRGKEKVVVDRGKMVVELTKPWSTKITEYSVSNISHIQINQALPLKPILQQYNSFSFPWNLAKRVQFDFNGRTHSFGIDIDPAQGRVMIEEMKNILPEKHFS